MPDATARENMTAMECVIEGQALLEGAKGQDFERVFIFGLKGEDIVIRQSSGLSRLATMGALFAALMETWGQITNRDGDEEDIDV